VVFVVVVCFNIPIIQVKKLSVCVYVLGWGQVKQVIYIVCCRKLSKANT
jgi:hypothetical protein